MYCVYLTIYSGKFLSPFYIGFSSVRKVEDGYNGSPSSKKYSKIYKTERSKNGHLFTTHILQEFKTVDSAMEAESRLQLYFDVINNKRFYNLAIHNLYEYEKTKCKFSIDRAIDKCVMLIREHDTKASAPKQKNKPLTHTEYKRSLSVNYNRVWSLLNLYAKMKLNVKEPNDAFYARHKELLDRSKEILLLLDNVERKLICEEFKKTFRNDIYTFIKTNH